MSAICQDVHFIYGWTLFGQSWTCLLMQYKHGFGAQLLSWSSQAITATLSSDHLLSYGQTPPWLHPYSSINFVSVLSHCLMSISLAALVHILAFPVRVSVMPLYIQAELIKMCNTILIPFIMAPISAKFMHSASFSLCNQLTSSTVISLCSRWCWYTLLL